MADSVDILRRALDQADRIVRAVGNDQLGGPTPCTDWSVRELVNHLVVGVTQFDAAARGDGFDFAAYGNDAIGDDFVGAWGRAAAGFRESLDEPGVLEQSWAMPGGPTPGAVAANVAIIEIQQHGWDLARATGQAAAFDPEVAETALAASKEMVGQFGRGGVFEDEVVAPDGAPPEDRLAAWLGRRPG